MPSPSLPCPVCAGLVMDDDAHIDQHVTWHEQTKTLGHKHGSYGTAAGLRAGFREMRAAVALVAPRDDDRPTEKLPPIGATIRRRPPVPEVRELPAGSAELLRAIADAIAADDELDGEEL